MKDMPPKQDWVGPAYRDALSAQSYEKSQLDGVRLLDLKLLSDEGGDFCEIARFLQNGALSDFSLMEPGAIKAWHLHRLQDDLWFVPPAERLLVGLLDVRDSSRTYQTHLRLTMGAGKPQCLFIPRGVAHGVANLGLVPATILYLVNQVFNSADPDEHRLPYDLLGADFWQIRPG
jgi:dTDP-4-dehydrorhamnose 3,5-epimerase